MFSESIGVELDSEGSIVCSLRLAPTMFYICAARVTVVGLYVCVCVCLCVCYSTSHFCLIIHATNDTNLLSGR